MNLVSSLTAQFTRVKTKKNKKTKCQKKSPGDSGRPWGYANKSQNDRIFFFIFYLRKYKPRWLRQKKIRQSASYDP